ncbi:MAG: hypothetical protein HY543_11200 [Deltaproteobacteria bacterium]|nr:hypothetical protein [Deltaproteobacteria bacterium]
MMRDKFTQYPHIEKLEEVAAIFTLPQLREANIPLTVAAIGEVMKRMGQDIKREGEGALERAGLEWKVVSPFVSRRTKTLFLDSLKRGGS